MSSADHIVGIVLAAGRGRRMGKTKQLLPWPPDDETGTVVAAAFDAVAPACEQMIVVTGCAADRVEAALAPREFIAVRCDADAEMLESVRAGLRAARKASPGATALVQPGDHPQVAPDTIAALLEAWADHRELAVMPEHDGRGGHPVLVPPTLASMVGEWMGTGGLRRFWREHPECCLRVPVDDPGVVQDLDTPEAYEQARPG